MVCVILGLWTAFEISQGAYVWAAVFGVAVAYLVWQFFVVFDPADYEDR